MGAGSAFEFLVRFHLTPWLSSAAIRCAAVRAQFMGARDPETLSNPLESEMRWISCFASSLTGADSWPGELPLAGRELIQSCISQRPMLSTSRDPTCG